MDRSLIGRFLLALLMGSAMLGAYAQDDNRGDDGGVGNVFDDDYDDDDDDRNDDRRFAATLRGVHEVPTISTPARGRFRAELDEASSVITWRLTYRDLEAAVEQAHIHIGQRHTNGGISAFLCTNLGNGPPDTQPCPDGPAEITGSITADHVVGPEDQGITAGEFEELVRAMRIGAAYVNIHTATFPAGEIRGQVVDYDDDDDDDDR